MRPQRTPNQATVSSQDTSSRRGTFHSQKLWKVAAAFCVLIAGFLWWDVLQKRDPNQFASAPLQELETVVEQKDAGQGFVAYHLGRRYANLGALDKARVALERAALLKVDYAPAWQAWASTLERAGDERAALQVLQVYIQNHPNDSEAHLALGRFYRRARAYNEAYTEAETAARLDPSSPKPWFLMGQAAAAAGDAPRAEAALRKALALQPGHWRAQSALGDVLVNLNREKEALPFLQHAVQLAPQQAQSQFALGRTLLSTATSASQIEQARLHLERSAQLRPDVPRTFLLLGQSFMRQSKWQQALQALKTLERLPHDAEMETARAYESSNALSRLGDEAAATRERAQHRKMVAYRSDKDIMSKRILEKPTDLALRLRLARLCANFDDFEYSIAAYQRLLTYAPQALAEKQDGVEQRVRLASLELAQVQRRAAGVQIALQAAKPRQAPSGTDGPDTDGDFSGDLDVPLTLAATLRDADYLLAQKRWDEAQSAYLSAAQTDEKSGLAFQGAGLAMMQGDDKAQGVNFLRRALSLDARLPQASFIIGSLCFQAGIRKGAVRYLEMATRDAPNNASYWHQLSAAYANEDAQLKEAENAARRATELNAKNVGYRLDWGEAQEAINKFDEAERTYRDVSTMAPQNPMVWARLGSLLVNRRNDAARQQEGVALLKRALESNPKDSYALFSLGRFYLKQKQGKDAVQFLQKAVAVSPDVSEIWYSLSRARQMRGDAVGAKKAMQRSQKISENYLAVVIAQEQIARAPRDSSLRRNLARRYAAAGRYAQAMQQYELGIKLKSQDTSLRRELDLYRSRLATSGETPSMDLFYALLAAADSAK